MGRGHEGGPRDGASGIARGGWDLSLTVSKERPLRTWQEGCCLQAREGVLIRTPIAALIWTSSLQDHEKLMSAVMSLCQCYLLHIPS